MAYASDPMCCPELYSVRFFFVQRKVPAGPTGEEDDKDEGLGKPALSGGVVYQEWRKLGVDVYKKKKIGAARLLSTDFRALRAPGPGETFGA